MPRGKAFRWIRNALIVIVCAVVVTPVVVYAFRHVREVSEQQTCAGNLKRLGEACAMYQADWHDVLVPCGAPFAFEPRGHMWPELLNAYVEKNPQSARPPIRRSRFFICPSADREEEDPCGMDRYYGLNTSCGGWMPGKKPVVVHLRDVKHPHSTIRMAEEKWKEQGGSFFAAIPSEFTPDDPACHMFAARHQGQGNVLWIDGHVSAMTLAQYNMRDKGPYDGNIWLRLEGPKPPLP